MRTPLPRSVLIASLIGAVALTACGSTPAKVGDRGQACYPNQTCNAELTCVDSFCVRLGAAGADGGAGSGGVAGTTGGAGDGAAGSTPNDGGAGNAADAEAGSPTDVATDTSSTFDLKKVPGLAYWFDAAKGVTIDAGGVSVWADQSGNGHTEVPGEGSGYPTVLPNAIHGLPILHFDSRRVSLVPQAAMNVFGTGEVLVELVAKAIVEPDHPSNLPFATTGSPQVNLGYDLAAKHTGFSLVATGQGTPKSLVGKSPTTAGPHVVAFHRTGAGATAKLELRLDGASDESETDPAYGQDLGDDVMFKGPADIAEVIVVIGTVSPADVAAIEGYLKTKYGL